VPYGDVEDDYNRQQKGGKEQIEQRDWGRVHGTVMHTCIINHNPRTSKYINDIDAEFFPVKINTAFAVYTRFKIIKRAGAFLLSWNLCR